MTFDDFWITLSDSLLQKLSFGAEICELQGKKSLNWNFFTELCDLVISRYMGEWKITDQN